jgi:hypothetical protein
MTSIGWRIVEQSRSRPFGGVRQASRLDGPVTGWGLTEAQVMDCLHSIAQM